MRTKNNERVLAAKKAGVEIPSEITTDEELDIWLAPARLELSGYKEEKKDDV